MKPIVSMIRHADMESFLSRMKSYAKLDYKTEYSRVKRIGLFAKTTLQNIPAIFYITVIVADIACFLIGLFLFRISKHQHAALFGFILLLIALALTIIAAILHSNGMEVCNLEFTLLPEFPTEEEFYDAKNRKLRDMMRKYMYNHFASKYNPYGLKTEEGPLKNEFNRLADKEILKQQKEANCNTYEDKVNFYRHLSINTLDNIMSILDCPSTETLFKKYQIDEEPVQTTPTSSTWFSPSKPNEPKITYWTCSYCGQKVEIEKLSCPHCLGVRKDKEN